MKRTVAAALLGCLVSSTANAMLLPQDISEYLARRDRCNLLQQTGEGAKAPVGATGLRCNEVDKDAISLLRKYWDTREYARIIVFGLGNGPL